MPTNATGLGVGKIIPGSSDPLTLAQTSNLPLGRGSQPPSTKASATDKNSFGGVVTPVNVETLYQAVSDHPVRELCSELNEGSRNCYSGPRSPRFSNNLPTAFLNPETPPSYKANHRFLQRY